MFSIRKTTMAAAAICIAAVAMLTSCNSKPVPQVMVNPLTYTDIPDNDYIRVGDTYYMISTTMYFCPGAPIMKSKDLVHWQIVNYIYDFIEDDDFYNLRNGKNAYGKGQWATTLRYVDGVYYALFICNEQGEKSYVFRTDDIESGKWVRNELPRKFHDASLLFDNDGRVYVVYGNTNIYVTELEPDLSDVKAGGVDQLLIEYPAQGYNLKGEGAHIYHIGDYYYILLIDWPRDPGCRTETCWRSKSLTGPYESKIVLQGKFDGRNDGVAQGAIVDTQYGDWYAIMFQDHGAVGRIPTIQPVTWVEDWPVMGDNTVPMKEVTVNLTAEGEDYVWANDEFDSDKLALVWQWNHKPMNEAWSLTERPGWMRLHAASVAQSVVEARNTLTQRSVGPQCISEVLLDASGLQAGDRAGLCAFQSNNCSVGVEVAEDGTKSLTIRENKRGTRMVPGQKPQPGRRPMMERYETNDVVYSEPLKSEKVWLRLDFVFTPAEGSLREADTVTASWSYDGENWETTDYSLKISFTLDFFTGYRPALFCYPTTQTGGYADFDYFHQEVY